MLHCTEDCLNLNIHSKVKKNLNRVWWLNPMCIYAGLLLLVILAWNTSSGVYRELYNIPEKAINGEYVVLYGISFIIFCIGYKFSKYPEKTDIFISFERLYKILYFITVAATIIWFVNFTRLYGLSALFVFLNMDELSKNNSTFFEESGTISGLTTMTEFGPIVASLCALIYKNTKKKKYIYEIIFLFILTLIRSAVFSQRVAFLEVFIPFIIVYLYDKQLTYKYNYLPVFAVVGIMVIFGIFEYPRSWSNYYVNHYDGTFVEFVVDRISGYYTCAINTECLLLNHYDAPNYIPFRSLNGFFYLPILNMTHGFAESAVETGMILSTYGNPEYNNPGGMLTWVVDWGGVGLLFSGMLGYFIGFFYKSFVAGNVLGIIVYPVCVYALLELPRLFFFGGKRGVFVLFAIFIVYRTFKSQRT